MTKGEVRDEAEEDEETAAEAEAVFQGPAIVGRTTLTAEDFRAVWAKLPQMRTAIRATLLAPMAIFGFAIISRLLSSDELDAPTPSLWIYLLGCALGIAAVTYGLWRGRRRWSDNAVNDLRGGDGVEYIFDASGVAINAPGRTSHTEWQSLHRYLDTPEAFVVYTGPVVCVVIPKRAFSSVDQVRLSHALSQLTPNLPLRSAGGRPGRAILVWAACLVVFLIVWQFLAR